MISSYFQLSIAFRWRDVGCQLAEAKEEISIEITSG
jgi:hypothetical protein